MSVNLCNKVNLNSGIIVDFDLKLKGGVRIVKIAISGGIVSLLKED